MKGFVVFIMLCVSISLFAGCGRAIETGDTTMAEMELTEKNQERLIEARPAPELDDSLERQNLIKYLEYWNNPDRMSYIYLMSRSGTVIGHYTIKGKITFCCSKLTTRDQILEVGTGASGAGRTRHTVESPGLDGSYGPSEDAIFFFTTENPDVPVVWKGDYLVSGVPMSINTKPVLVRQIK